MTMAGFGAAGWGVYELEQRQCVSRCFMFAAELRVSQRKMVAGTRSLGIGYASIDELARRTDC